MSLEIVPGIEEADVLGLEGDDFGLRASLDACVKCTICETQCPVMRVTDLFAGPKYSGSPQCPHASCLWPHLRKLVQEAHSASQLRHEGTSDLLPRLRRTVL